MAYITDLNRDIADRMFTEIREALRKRGLTLVYKKEWEKHGPHQDMEYEIFVGAAKGPWGSSVGCVVIYPWGVWAIDGSDVWHRPNGHEGERITILRR